MEAIGDGRDHTHKLVWFISKKNKILHIMSLYFKKLSSIRIIFQL